MNLLGRKKDNSGEPADASDGRSSAESDDSTTTQENSAADRGTAPKGRPTPKRSEATKRRGPVAPAPMTAAEARRRRKELKGPKLSREDRKIERIERRAAMSDRRERMMAGEDAYLLPRDKGPVRRYVRDIVDARRNVLGLFMPAALMLLFVMLAVPSIEVQRLISPAMLLLVVLMAIDAVILGRKVNRMVDAKFPKAGESPWKLGLYAAGRASQMRRMRAPRPQVDRGASVS